MGLKTIILLLLVASTIAWRCPEYSLDFKGNDITAVSGVQSWDECASHCYENLACSHWTWGVPNGEKRRETERNRSPGYYNNRCYLKDSDIGGRRAGGFISGSVACVASVACAPSPG
eukprot:GFUD01111540.1.p1 GENE.GFUD01111540.1~~GFUD01111540.1.p1  ORF type:complete len:117 (-),score=15.46 GFUD01111540.1:192-542(-)